MEINAFWIKNQDKYKRTLRIFSSKNKSFHDPQKVSKSTVLNTMHNACRSGIKYFKQKLKVGTYQYKHCQKFQTYPK